jgi:hypothetical protein
MKQKLIITEKQLIGLVNKINEDVKSKNLGKKLGEITGVPESDFKYFETKQSSDLNSFYSFADEMSQKIKQLDQTKINEMIDQLDYVVTLYDVSEYEKKLIDFIKKVITSQSEHLQTIKQNPYLSHDKTINDIVTNSDNDYEYKKENNKYYFKLKTNPKSPEAQKLKKRGKFTNWVLAKGNAEKSIKKLFNS